MIPEEWEVKKLGEFGKFKNGINKSEENFGFGYPFVNLMDVFEHSMIDKSRELGLINSTVTDRKVYDLKAGDVLFIRSSVKPSGVGLTAVLLDDLEDTVFSGFLIRFRDMGALDARFKKHCFFSERFRRSLISSSTISANTNINQNALKVLTIPLPPTKTEQNAIATALSDADSLISGLKTLIAKKRAIKEGAMKELLKPKDTWAETTLGELGPFLKGSGVTRSQAKSGELPCIRYGEIYTHHDDFIREFNSWISRDVAESALLLKKGDILFAGSGETKAEIGKAVAFLFEEEAYAGGDIVVLRPLDVDSLFLGYYLNTPWINAQKASRGQGDAVVHIHASALASITLVLPTPKEQSAIATILSDMDAEIATLETKLQKARAIKAGMMAELLTGKIRLI